MVNHWIFRIKDGENFKNSIPHSIWGIKSWTTNGKNFIKEGKQGDIIWFILNKVTEKSEPGNHIYAMATYSKIKRREIGPLIDLTLSSEQLGWEKGDVYDLEVHYNKLYLVDEYNLYISPRSQAPILKDKGKYGINLPVEYTNIVRYLKAVVQPRKRPQVCEELSF